MKSSSITITKTTGSGYTSVQSIVVVPAAGNMGATATAAYSGSGIASITMVNNGYSYGALPTI